MSAASTRVAGPPPTHHSADDYRRLSLWHEQAAAAGDDLTPRAPLGGDTDADVAIVGGGFTGLWSAYYLLRAQPALRVVVVEADIAGFGASGRNGGWCSALFPQGVASMSAAHGRQSALAMRRAMTATVDEVGEVAHTEGIECGWAKGGTISLARSAAQLARARADTAEDERFDGVDSIDFLDADAAWARLAAARLLGASFTPNCARIQPARLVRGLARAVERLGGTIVEGTRARDLRPGRVETDHGTVRAEHVVRATEAWTSTLPGHARTVVPVYSLMIATEPLPAGLWSTIGLARGETFTEHRNLIVYGQRSADDRLVFGGRGAPYHFRSGIDPAYDSDPAVFSALRETLHDLLPQTRDAAVTHAWGGPLAIARDWHAGVGLDRATGMAWAGGYVGDGVGTTNLAGRTLADLILGVDSELVRLPWVGHHSPRWEPEPLRWLGVNAGLRVAQLADTEERVLKRPGVFAGALARLTGH